jgi:hypothetical protein
MKKLGIILTAAVVLFAFVAPLFAMEMYEPEARAAKLMDEKASVMKASGEFTFGAITPFDAAKGNIGFYNMYVDFTLYPDEYNAILFELAGSKAFTQSLVVVDPADPLGFSQGAIFSVPYFQLTTDVGAALGLPVGLKNTAGLTSLYSRKYEVTGHAYERSKVRSWIDPLAWKFEVDAGMATATFALGFGEGSDTLNDIGVLVDVPEVGPASLELFYLVQDNADYKGNFGIDAKATDLVGGMLGVAAGFKYDTLNEAWAYGVGASVTYSPATIGVSLNGDDVNTVDQLGIDVDAAFTDTYGATVAAGLSLADGADTFQGADIGVYAKVGAAKWSVGYAITDGNGYAYVPAVAGIDGGLYLNVDIDF